MTTVEPEEITVLDALHSTPSRRYLSTRPIPDHVIRAILDAAVRGPNGGNRQAWGWVVVTDPVIKKPIAGWYREGWEQADGRRREEILRAEPTSTGMSRAGDRCTGTGGTSFLAADHLGNGATRVGRWRPRQLRWVT